MRSITTSIQTRIMFIAGLALLLLCAGAIAGLGYQIVTTRDVEARAQQVRQQQVEVLTISLLFNQQVQEWNNVLLRGKDPALRDKYWAAFNERSQQIEALGGSLVQRMPPGDLRDLVRGFMDLHGAMVFAYGLGLDAYKAAVTETLEWAERNAAQARIEKQWANVERMQFVFGRDGDGFDPCRTDVSARAADRGCQKQAAPKPPSHQASPANRDFCTLGHMALAARQRHQA